MLKDIVAAKPLDGYRLHLRFEDGAEGNVDVSALVPFTGVFAVLREPETFAAVRVDPELGTVVWPNGADLDPAVLYSSITGAPLPGMGGADHAR
ncbi:molybdopterin-guanine dinucleotide biosynthesis protein A [Azospirillum sp. TSH7]|jgi:hypothetical protein|uniref:DUF2442 domain-containing protein n=1 Tax=unclassified Azospirillum TaxID=2630922 RepID=UPI000D61DD87|nr:MULTISPECIES: DUF2442 domain-containing protein [unclassified Azospirillum]PWC67158.1 molybdopterin-guanine dinucleotide biosynthesis protein A [Azospirillum sp. TSH20]PWC69023.1 molybdopterin-guanine dinucleotide biosynthesis protein A [Azospirillum sp. TSH7]